MRFWHVDKNLSESDPRLRIIQPRVPHKGPSAAAAAAAKGKKAAGEGVKVRCLAFRPPMGDHLAVCFYSGHLQVWAIDPATGLLPAIADGSPSPDNGVALLAERKDSDRWVQEAKYSFEGSVLALGCHDRAILLYYARDGAYNLLRKVTRHSSYVTHLDFGVNFDYDRRKGEPAPHMYTVDHREGCLIHPITYVRNSAYGSP